MELSVVRLRMSLSLVLRRVNADYVKCSDRATEQNGSTDQHFDLSVFTFFEPCIVIYISEKDQNDAHFS